MMPNDPTITPEGVEKLVEELRPPMDFRTPEARKWPDTFIPPETCAAIDDVQNALEHLRDANSQLRHAAYLWKHVAEDELRRRVRLGQAVDAAQSHIPRQRYERAGDFVMTDKSTMTLNLPPAEMAYVKARATECDMSKTAVVRSALRLYQLVTERLKAGETMHFSGDKERIALFVGPDFPPPTKDQNHE
jgi:hypothetical protein